ncbi:MAG: nodulation protein NfeD [Firmicutes bacterium]|nr:nodulation protein NfeD [Bacillota bacterium]
MLIKGGDILKIGKNLLLIFVFLILFSNISLADNNDVYVIPIEGEINKATYQFVRDKVEEIKLKNPKAIIFKIDTYGGLIDKANDIKELIMDLDTKTIAFVDKKAESAGVLITISCESIVMSDRATIGAAETIPNTEKVMSLWLRWLTDTAKDRNRNPKVIASMADKDLEIKDLVNKGELLTLGNEDAKELGISDLTANSHKEILNKFNMENSNIINLNKDFKTKIAQFIVNPYIATFLLSVGFIGLLIELFTPGFAAGGTLSLIAFALFFGGNYLAGNSTLGSIILFIAGLILVIIELGIPGFGVPGIGGIVCVITSIVLASGSIETAILSLSIAVILTIVTAVLLIKYGARSPYLDKIILKTKQENDNGYTSMPMKDKYLNKKGIALTTLRPAGTILINDDRVDAVTEGGYIEKGCKIKVIKVQGTRVVVREHKE